MKKELHLFIIWKNALNNKDKIINDINNTFKIRNKFMVSWSDQNFSSNLSRFYGTKLPDGSAKEVHCGRGDFLLIVVEDDKPLYETRNTSRGSEVVNTKMFDKKTLYREWTGGGHKIHATNDTTEFNHDITLLLGVNEKDFIKKYKPNKSIKKINKDVIGSNSWSSVEEIFYVLNNTTKYVVLRDFENDLKELYSSSYDADILCTDKDNMIWILNAEKTIAGTSIQYKVNLKNQDAYFDIKYYGDGYYCTKMEHDIINSRIYNNFYYIPNKEYWYMSSLYHALVHKFNFESEYNARLGFLFGKKIHNSEKNKDYFIKKCDKWLIDHEYQIVNYMDNPYNFNEDNINKFNKILYADNLFRINHELLNKQDTINYLNEQLRILAEDHYRTINSKGWRFLNKLRKVKKILKK